MKYICYLIGIIILGLVASTTIGLVLKPPPPTVIWVPLIAILILGGAAGVAFIVNAVKWGNEHPS